MVGLPMTPHEEARFLNEAIDAVILAHRSPYLPRPGHYLPPPRRRLAITGLEDVQDRRPSLGWWLGVVMAGAGTWLLLWGAACYYLGPTVSRLLRDFDIAR